MPVNLKGRSFLTLKDFSSEEIRYLLDLAHDLKAKKRAGIKGNLLEGRNIVLLFEKTSTRTRCAFEVAAYDEGANCTFLSNSQMGKKESLEDTAKVLGRFYDGIEFRGFKQSDVELLAKYSGVPVWNGLTDLYHPTQILADLLTIEEHVHKSLNKVKFVYAGDARNNMGNSLMIGAAKMGMDFVGLAPKELFPSKELKGKSKIGDYGDLVMMIDDIVGRVNRKLKEIGKYDNTIVMFAADNGCAGYINMDRINRKGHYPSYIYRGYKSHGWEGGHRIPFILSWGDRYGHVTDNSLVSLTDLYATFADMLGYRIADDEAEDSFSFWPILDGSGNAARTDLIATSGAGYFTYRTPQYKLIFNAGNGSGEEYRIDGQPPLQFYDMVNDPEEKVNQINNPEYAGRIREMAARVKKYIEDGRSTPGAKAANDGGNSWKQITDIMSGLYAGNR